jgi:3-oxoadipate enol-lactonase
MCPAGDGGRVPDAPLPRRGHGPAVTLHYELAGSGPPLLWISGSGGDIRKQFGPFDSPVPDHYTVLAYDQRGLGRSSKPDVAYTMADYADDAASLLDHVGWDRCRVIGVSFGGMVAQHLAVRHPQRVERMVLCCTSSGGAGGSSYPLHALLDLEPETARWRRLELADKRRDDEWRRSHPQQAATMYELMVAAEQVGADEPDHEVGSRRQLEARRGHDTWDALVDVDVPTLVAGGRHDGIAPPANLERLAGRVPAAQLRFFDGGHLFFVQDPQAWPAIVEFLAG